MVALKLARETDHGIEFKGSRNAVVALKPGSNPRRCGSGLSKQERRGGIETGILPRSPLPADAKQERRGGIETGASPGGWAADLRKQERRGGIETGQQGVDLGGENEEAGTPWWH